MTITIYDISVGLLSGSDGRGAIIQIASQANPAPRRRLSVKRKGIQMYAT